jgi:Methylamine utilisation protein MauE
MSSAASLMVTAQVLAAQLAAFQALLLAVSAVHKAATWSRSLGVMRQFGGVRNALAGPTLAMVIVGELLSGSLLLVPAFRTAGAIMAVGLWTLYLGLILRAILQNRRDQECGCSFGLATSASSRPLGWFQVARNSLLAVMALGIAALSTASGSVAVEPSQVLGGIALLALYGALDQVMALQPLRSGEVL